MKLFKKIGDIYNGATVKIQTQFKIFFIFLFVCVIVSIGFVLIKTLIFGEDRLDDDAIQENVFLYEETIFADEIFIKCIGINVINNDEDQYVLNLQMQVEQWNTDINVNQQIISPNMFELRLVDMNASSPMSVFIESLATATVSVIAAGALGGEINVIKETIGFASNYINGSIENSVSSKEEAIPALQDSFQEFYPYENNGETSIIEVSFILTDNFLDSTKTMVLSIDTAYRIEKNIFLVLRPNTEPYMVIFNLNGGSSDAQLNPLSLQPGILNDLPNDVPTRDGYQFLYWTTELDDPSKKIRDLYFYTYNENESFTVYAFYQEKIPLDDFVNINESLNLIDDNYLITIKEYDYINNIQVLNEESNLVDLDAPSGKKYLALIIEIQKIIAGDNHILDNNDDFYLENDYVGTDVSEYYGYMNEFESIKPIDDYSWIGLELNEIDTYTVTLYFEVNETLNIDDNLCFLEIDFFWLSFAKSILIQE